jgi:hypothetical protein
VDKTLNQLLFKQNIKKWVWGNKDLPLNLRAMEKKTKPSDAHKTTPKACNSNENMGNSNGSP